MKNTQTIMCITIGFLIGYFVIGPLMVKPKPSVMWGEDFLKAHPELFNGAVTTKSFRFVMLQSPNNGPSYELGLRSDGVVVWREVKK